MSQSVGRAWACWRVRPVPAGGGLRHIRSRGSTEYEEEIYVNLDGSATVYVNAAVPALVALRGVDLPLDPSGPSRSATTSARSSRPPVASVANVSTSRRDGRRYVHVRLEVPDIRRLSEAAMFAWSRYRSRRLQ